MGIRALCTLAKQTCLLLRQKASKERFLDFIDLCLLSSSAANLSNSTNILLDSYTIVAAVCSLQSTPFLSCAIFASKSKLINYIVMSFDCITFKLLATRGRVTQCISRERCSDLIYWASRSAAEPQTPEHRETTVSFQDKPRSLNRGSVTWDVH